MKNKDPKVLYDTKWELFIKKTWIFKYIPFVEFIFGSGSLALENISEDSDFDVLIGAKEGRIFTARFFSVLILNLSGWRRGKGDHNLAAKDKICLNHFITPSSYSLQREPSLYWKILYEKLVPVYGKEDIINKFYEANQESDFREDLRYLHKEAGGLKKFIEYLFRGSFGDNLEKILKNFQVKKIRKSLKKKPVSKPNIIRAIHTNEKIGEIEYDLPPVIKYSDSELEFHPDPAIIQIIGD